MSTFIYPKPTPIAWMYAVTIDELARPTSCHFCSETVAVGSKCLVTSDFDGIKLIHAEHFERVDNGQT